jgi:hypothetical protein
MFAILSPNVRICVVLAVAAIADDRASFQCYLLRGSKLLGIPTKVSACTD